MPTVLKQPHMILQLSVALGLGSKRAALGATEEQSLTVIAVITHSAWAKNIDAQLQIRINCGVIHHFQPFEEVYSSFIPVVDWAKLTTVLF